MLVRKGLMIVASCGIVGMSTAVLVRKALMIVASCGTVGMSSVSQKSIDDCGKLWDCWNEQC